MSKEVRIRLYRVQDYELYTLYFDRSFPLGYALRQVVLAYANGDPTPVFSVKNVQKCPKGKPFVVTTSFLLHDSETNAIEMINKLSSNGRNANNFVKHLLRRSLVDIESLYFDEEEQEDYKDTGVETGSNQRTPQKRKPAKPAKPVSFEDPHKEFETEPVKEVITLKENDEEPAEQIYKREIPREKPRNTFPTGQENKKSSTEPQDAFAMFSDILQEF